MAAKGSRPPRIVAELGRPETPEETAARKASNSRAYRESKTVRNLVVALVASLGIVLFLVLIVVRPTPAGVATPVDYVAIAAEAQDAVSEPLAAPVLPAGWVANVATFDGSETNGSTWSIGLITNQQGFIKLAQGIGVDEGWVSGYLGRFRSTGTTVIDGITWDIYDRRTSDDPGNYAYSLAGVIGGSRILLYGTATDEEFAALASILAAELGGTSPPTRTVGDSATPGATPSPTPSTIPSTKDD